LTFPTTISSVAVTRSQGVRRYVPFPTLQIGRLPPVEASLLESLLAAAGVAPITRLLAGEEVWISATTRELASAASLGERTVRSALAALADLRLIDRENLGRSGMAIRLRPELWGLSPHRSERPDVPIDHQKPAADADREPAHPFHAHEEIGKGSGAGLAALAARIYAALFSIVLFGQVLTTKAIRARLRRTAHMLAIAGVGCDVIEREGWNLARERGRLPSPEEIALEALRQSANHAAFRSTWSAAES
jgi:hypothetical protein